MEAIAYQQFRELERTHWWFRGRRTVYFGLLRRWLGGNAPQRTLDLGAGLGGFLPGLSELSQHVWPADVDRESLVHCRERGFSGGVVSNGYALPYRAGSFDLVCLFDAIEHIPDDAKAMREVMRVLRPGGHVFVSVPAYPFLFSNNDRVAQHQRRYTRGQLRVLFEGAGLAVARSTHTNVLLFPLILPIVLGIKLFERLSSREADSERTNLSWRMPRALHALLHLAFAAELPINSRIGCPAGHSIAALARKPVATPDGQA